MGQCQKTMVIQTNETWRLIGDAKTKVNRVDLLGCHDRDFITTAQLKCNGITNVKLLKRNGSASAWSEEIIKKVTKIFL